MRFPWSTHPYVAEVFLDDVPNLISEMTGTDAVSTFQSFMTVILGAIALAFENVDTGITNAVSGFFLCLDLCRNARASLYCLRFIFSHLDNFKDYYCNYFSGCSDFLRLCDVSCNS